MFTCFSSCLVSFFHPLFLRWIVRVRYKFTEESERTCPCSECLTKPETDRCKNFGKVMVWTAKHLVYDTEEAKSSVVQLFYDSEDSSREKIFLSPYKVWKGDVRGDWIGVKCVTHDLELWDRLKANFEKCGELQQKVDEKYKSGDEKFSVIVSHPHGLCKRVTFGRWLDRHEWEYNGDKIQTIYIYTNDTCTGSSGAPLWVIGRKVRGMNISHPHSRVDIHELKLNRSGVGFDY